MRNLSMIIPFSSSLATLLISYLHINQPTYSFDFVHESISVIQTIFIDSIYQLILWLIDIFYWKILLFKYFFLCSLVLAFNEVQLTFLFLSSLPYPFVFPCLSFQRSPAVFLLLIDFTSPVCLSLS